MDNVTPAPPRRHRQSSSRRNCRYRVVGSGMANRYVIIERMTDRVVEAGFDSYEGAWSRIMALLDGRRDD